MDILFPLSQSLFSGLAARFKLNEGRLMWMSTLAILALLWGVIVGVGFDRQHANAREGESLATSNAKGFSEYVGLHLLITDRMLINLRERYARLGDLPPNQALTQDFGDMAPLLLQVAISDAQGNITASSLPLGKPVSIKDRPHFQVFQDNPADRLHFSQPVVGRVSGKMSLQLVRPMLDARGGFAGVIVASIDPLKLQQYFEAKDAFANGGAVVIVGVTDAVVRARFTAGNLTWGENLFAWEGWSRLVSRREGIYVGDSVIDRRPRTYGFHRVGSYPLAVTVGTFVAPWPFDEMALSMGIGLVLTVYMTLYTWMRVRRLHEQELLIDQLRKSHQREQEAGRLKTNFLASISHELRTPLNSILGFSEIIRDLPTDPGNGRFADLIHTSGKHLLALLNTLLDSAKIEAGRMEVEREPVDLGQLLETLADVHRGSAERKGLELGLSLALPAGQSAWAETDGTKFTQVFNNLLNNAVKFTATGKVTLDACVDSGRLVVTVADTGCGIAPDELPKIFDRFSTVHHAGQREDAGTGLGLSLSRDLVALLGGAIHIESQPGQGTRVTVTLPGVRLQESTS